MRGVCGYDSYRIAWGVMDMHIYFLLAAAASPAGGADAEQEHPDQARLDRAQSLLQGLRTLSGQLDFIITSPGPACAAIADLAARYFVMPEFCAWMKTLASGGSPESVSKELNRLIGKEHVLVVLSWDMFFGGIRFLCGDDSLPGDFAPAPLCLVHVHSKGFPNRGQGRVVEIFSGDDLLNKK